MQAILTRLSQHPPQIRRLLRVLLGTLLALGVVVALLPMEIPDMGIDYTDKLIHALVFLGFAALMNLAVLRSFWRWQAPFLLAYGLGIEILQLLVPWRTFSWLDFMADAAGILLYWLAWKGVWKLWRGKLRQA